MPHYDNLGDFIKHNKSLLKEYIETRLDLYRLQGARQAARLGGFLIWIVIALFLLFLILIFCGITMGYWFSSITDSYVLGFGIATGVLILMMLLITVLRRALFVNPIMRNILKQFEEKHSHEEEEEEDEQNRKHKE
jgi:small-conductance mechanosensitive channel